MLAFTSVWIGLISLVVAMTMWAYRPAFTDASITIVLYFAAPGAMCLAGLVLWAYRKEPPQAGIDSQRLQAKVAVLLALASAVIVYALIIGSDKFESIDATAGAIYNRPQEQRSG